MYLSTSNWIKILLVIGMHNGSLNAATDQFLDVLEDYKSFYYNVIKMDKGSTFLVNSLWVGVQNLQNRYDNEGQLANNKCHSDIDVYKRGLREEEDWALRMFDSSTHLQSGFLEGNVIDYGNIDECVKVVNENDKISGRMCHVVFRHSQNNLTMVLERYMITFSICVPSSCDKYELHQILRHGIPFLTYFFIGDCYTNDEFSPPFDPLAYYIIMFFIILFMIICISTLYDVIRYWCCDNTIEGTEDKTSLIQQAKKYKSKFEGILVSFSLYSNGKALFQEDTKDESIKVLHGLRFFAACGVLSVHRHLLDPQPFTNMFMFEEEIRKWYRMMTFNAYLWVDVFFVMSGLLVSYNFLMRTEYKRKLNVWKFYMHRYIRLTPTLAAVILINLLSDHMCSGPHCSYLNKLFKGRCEKNWWVTLIYINNIFDQFNMCVIQSWYLAADMQLYWLAPILLYTLIRWPRLIFIELLLLFTATATYVFFVSYELGLLPTFIGTNQFFEDDSRFIYNQSFARAGPWLIGFALGIIIHQHNQEPTKISKFSVVLGWIMSIIFCTGAMFGIAPFIQKNYEGNPIVSSLFKALYRDVWALGFAWIIYACYTGHGGWVNTFLSSYIFHPISRLTYSFYLIHIFGQFLQFQNGYVPRRYSDITQFSILSGDVVIGIILAVALYLSVEAPALNLERVFSNRKVVKEVEEPKRRIVKEA